MRKFNLNLFVLIILIISFTFDISEAQQNVFLIGVKGGISYLPLGNWSDAWNEFSQHDKTTPFTFSLSITYFSSSKHSFIFEIGFITDKVTAKDNISSAEWSFKGYPISFDYRYFLKLSKFKPFIGAGILYVISDIKIRASGQQGRVVPLDIAEAGYGAEGNLGFLYKLYSKLNLISELKIRYINASAFSSSRKYFKADYTGLYLLIGLNYKL